MEVLSADDELIHVVLLSHRHTFYEPGTPEDAERRAFHEGVISAELGGQREFSWGEVICRFENALNKDWLVVACNRESRVPTPGKDVLLRLLTDKRMPEE